ncbi:MAG: DUF2723 domain-containing protein [bacterium]|nr:DUF2723 domain-containing protein [bacterium]
MSGLVYEEMVEKRFADYGAVFVLLVSFGIYLLTLTPTVGLHDSGDMITSSYVLGIAHPPGYPLYTLFGKGWMTVIPIGNIAYRMNMQSALFASLAVMMVYLIILKLSISNYQLAITRIIPGVVAALIFAFSTTFWEQAVIAEKYTLNAFFFSLLIFILLKWQETYNLQLTTYNYLYLFAFILGLSFTHHFQTIYIVPAAIFFLFSHRGHREHRGRIHFKFSISNLAFQKFKMLNAKFAISDISHPLSQISYCKPKLFENGSLVLL